MLLNSTPLHEAADMAGAFWSLFMFGAWHSDEKLHRALTFAAFVAAVVAALFLPIAIGITIAELILTLAVLRTAPLWITIATSVVIVILLQANAGLVVR